MLLFVGRCCGHGNGIILARTFHPSIPLLPKWSAHPSQDAQSAHHWDACSIHYGLRYAKYTIPRWANCRNVNIAYTCKVHWVINKDWADKSPLQLELCNCNTKQNCSFRKSYPSSEGGTTSSTWSLTTLRAPLLSSMPHRIMIIQVEEKRN